MEAKITPTSATLGAFVTDIELAELTDITWQIVESAFHEYGVLIFPDQNLSDQEQIDFGARFGEIEHLVPNMNSVPISNQKADGSVIEAGGHHSQILRGNEFWHTDSSYMPLASKASIVSAHLIPPEGDQTEWADMCGAYDELDDDTKDRIADLSAQHSLYFSQARIGHVVEQGTGYGFHSEDPPSRPVVKVHPETGRGGSIYRSPCLRHPGPRRGRVGDALGRPHRLRLPGAAHLYARMGTWRHCYLGQPMRAAPSTTL